MDTGTLLLLPLPRANLHALRLLLMLREKEMKKRRIMWDLFCGLKGASAAFDKKKWTVISVDIEPLFKPTILGDLKTLDITPEEKPDFVWASPPCTEYALRRFDPTIEPSLELVEKTYDLIQNVLKPKFWAIENVRHSVPYITKVLGPHRQAVGPYFLWGNFPRFLPSPVSGKGSARGPHWLRSAIRAKIPHSLSSDVESAVSYVLNQQERRILTKGGE